MQVENDQWPVIDVTEWPCQCDRVTSDWCDRVTSDWCDRVTSDWCDRVTMLMWQSDQWLMWQSDHVDVTEWPCWCDRVTRCQSATYLAVWRCTVVEKSLVRLSPEITSALPGSAVYDARCYSLVVVVMFLTVHLINPVSMLTCSACIVWVSDAVLSLAIYHVLLENILSIFVVIIPTFSKMIIFVCNPLVRQILTMLSKWKY